MSLNVFALNVKPSPTLAIAALVEERRKSGGVIYNFGIGETNPIIPCPRLLKDEIVKAVENDETHYSATAGDSELIAAVIDDCRVNFGQTFSPENIIICPGPKDAIFKTLLALLDPHAKAKGDRYKEALASQPIKVVILNSPNNPAGCVYPPSLVESVTNVVKEFENVFIISDEVYRTIRYDALPFASPVHYAPERTIAVAGASKEVSGTGLRVGWAAGPKEIIATMCRIEGNTSSCVNLPSQRGLARFLKADADMSERSKITEQLRTRRDAFVAPFSNAVPHAKFIPCQGAFYFFPDVSFYLNRSATTSHDGETKKFIASDEDLAAFILEEEGVVCLPGSKFQMPGHLRFALCYDMSILTQAMAALKRAFDRIEV